MSWETDKFKATCDACGHEGEVHESSDDWFRFSRSYVGFDSVPPDPTSVARKRLDARQQSGMCPKCGGTSITRGALITE
jgi:predicted RNA-binding Zn-ribbon protein involved in translation (DUF1610 family)